MDSSTWIAVYMPIFILLFIIIPSQKNYFLAMKVIKRKRGFVEMSNELIKSYVGKVCNISTGSLGPNFNKVRIIEVKDNWIKVEGKGKADLINTDFIQSIKILPID